MQLLTPCDVQLTKSVGRYFPCLATRATAHCWARLARIHSGCRNANITEMTSLGNSMLDLCLSRGEPESKVTSTLSVWLAFAVLVGIPLFVRTVIDIVTGGHYVSGDKWVGLVAPPGLVLFGTLLPKLGRLLRKKQRTVYSGTLTKHSCCAYRGTRAMIADLGRTPNPAGRGLSGAR
jgi:hypothetical protein